MTAVLSGLQSAQQTIHQDSTVAARALESAFPDLSGPLLEEGMFIYLPAVPPTPLITAEAYSISLEVFGLSGVPFEEAVDNSFIEGE